MVEWGPDLLPTFDKVVDVYVDMVLDRSDYYDGINQRAVREAMLALAAEMFAEGRALGRDEGLEDGRRECA